MLLSLSAGDTVILFLGHLHRQKGIYELLNIFARLAKGNKSLHLLLVGEALERARIQKFIRKKGIESQVKLTGAVPHRDIVGYLNAGDLFVFPSWSEGLPNAVMEACACELPVIASNVGGIPELINQGKSGILVSPHDEEKFYAEIVKLLESPELGSRLGKVAREKW